MKPSSSPATAPPPRSAKSVPPTPSSIQSLNHSKPYGKFKSYGKFKALRQTQSLNADDAQDTRRGSFEGFSSAYSASSALKLLRMRLTPSRKAASGVSKLTTK